MDNETDIIDAQQYFWQLAHSNTELCATAEVLQRDFLPGDLQPLLSKMGIAKTIAVQTTNTQYENEFLLRIANDVMFVAAVIGWIDVQRQHAPDRLAELAQDPYWRGIRVMLDTLPELESLLTNRLAPLFTMLIELQLTIELVAQPQHVRSILRWKERWPELACVIIQAPQPTLTHTDYRAWAAALTTLAQHSDTYYQLAGLSAAIDDAWTIAQLTRYLDHIFGCFGTQRILWGSGWPLLKRHSSYQQWFELCRDYVFRHHPQALNSVFGTTAKKFYIITPKCD